MDYATDITKYSNSDTNPDSEGFVTYVDKNCNQKNVCASQRITNMKTYEGNMYIEDTIENKRKTRLG